MSLLAPVSVRLPARPSLQRLDIRLPVAPPNISALPRAVLYMTRQQDIIPVY